MGLAIDEPATRWRSRVSVLVADRQCGMELGWHLANVTAIAGFAETSNTWTLVLSCEKRMTRALTGKTALSGVVPR